jgi:uncharacterized membrane protein
MLLALLNVLLGIVGFCIAFYIFHKKTHETLLVCPIGSDCNAVVHSDYSKLLGIPVERIGMVYYFLITTFYAAALFTPALTHGLVHFIMLGITLGAFVFSIYLVGIQAIVIKQWCVWCLGSATVSTLMFLANFILNDTNAIPYLVEYKGFIVLIHGIAAAIGLGAATTTDFLFFRFLKDKKISQGESDIMDALSKVIWMALGLMIITGVGIYLPQTDVLNHTAKFLAKMTVLGVIIINGFALNIVIAPRLTKINFDKDVAAENDSKDFIRHLAFALGAVSITSWYFVFIMGSLRKVSLSYDILILIYLAVLIVGLLGSQLFAERVRTMKGE